MLTVNDLVGLDKVPHINDISLKLYKDYCTQILLERRFVYYFTDSTIFEVKFKEWGIYHMLSIQHINWKIKKEDFFKEIDNGLSFANFKSTPSINARFKNEKERITMFACIYNTLRYGQVFYVPSGKVKNTNNVDVDLLWNNIPVPSSVNLTDYNYYKVWRYLPWALKYDDISYGFPLRFLKL